MEGKVYSEKTAERSNSSLCEKPPPNLIACDRNVQVKLSCICVIFLRPAPPASVGDPKFAMFVIATDGPTSECPLRALEFLVRARFSSPGFAGEITAKLWSGTKKIRYLDFVTFRYNADGSLGTTFDADGKLTTSFGDGNDSAHTVAVQTDGKIVVAGISITVNGNIRSALVRYNTNGSLDPSFGTSGKVITGTWSITDIALQPDGKIVAAQGWNGFSEIYLMNPDGTDQSRLTNNSGKTGSRGVPLFQIRDRTY